MYKSIVMLTVVIGVVCLAGPTLRGQEQTSGTDAANERGEPGFTDLSHDETVLTETLPFVGRHDGIVEAFGAANEEACILVLEGFTLRAFRSSDAGQTYQSGVTVFGGSGTSAVHGFGGALAPDGRLYVAILATDPSGGWRMLATRSDDMGTTWTVPATVAASPGPTPDHEDLNIDAAAGIVAITYPRYGPEELWVATSVNQGADWTLRRIDAGEGAVFNGDVAIDPATGTIHVAFSADATVTGAIWVPWTTRSFDSGMTFEPPVNRTSLLPTLTASLYVDLEIAGDGSILWAMPCLNASSYIDEFRVFRSTNQGVSYSLSHLETFTTYFDTATFYFRLAASDGAAVLVSYMDDYDTMVVHRSTNYGASFGSRQPITGTVIRYGWDHRPPLVRTPDGNWAIVWEDTRNRIGIHGSDIYVRTSTNDGLTWGPEQQVNTVPQDDTYSSTLPAIAATGTDQVVVAYLDTRVTGGESSDVYANVTTAASPSFGVDAAVDDDLDMAPKAGGETPALAADGDRHVYVAFTTSSRHDLYLSISDDKGRSFMSPVLLSSGPVQKIAQAVSATSDGNVYVVYTELQTDGSQELLAMRSTDYGATWPGEPVSLGSDQSEAVSVASIVGGRFYTAWSDNSEVFLAYSSDAGETFAMADMQQSTTTYDRRPVLCAQGDRVVVAWVGRRPALTEYTVLANFSEDGGATFGPLVDLRPSGASYFTGPRLACDGQGGALVVWYEARAGSQQLLWRNRLQGASWTGAAEIAAQPGDRIAAYDVTYVDPAGQIAAVAFQIDRPEEQVFVARSTDGGSSFTTYERLDLTVPVPSSRDQYVRIASDRMNRVWITWLDGSLQTWWSLALTRSVDAGVSFESVVRVNRETPQGAMANWYRLDRSPVVPLPGVGLFSWTGQRNSLLFDPLFNRDVYDEDVDGSPVGTDCDDLDPTAQDPPVDVTGLFVGSGSLLQWDSPGSGYRYDVAGGNVGDLVAGGVAAAACLTEDETTPQWTDPRSDPAPGHGYYYIVRMENGCGTGGYGPDSDGVVRVPSGACP